METVTVEAAIRKGRLHLGLIPLWTLLVLILLSAVVTVVGGINGSIEVLVSGIGIGVLSFLVLGLYRTLMRPRWWIWALSSVRNVHELKRLAIRYQFYPEDNSFWRRDWITATQAEILRNLEQRFQQPDIFEDDYSIPFQLKYFYPKYTNSYFFILSIAALSTVFVVYGAGNIVLIATMLLWSIWAGIDVFKSFKKTGLMLTISEEGITTLKKGFHSWGDIRNERTFYVSLGKTSNFGLSYEAYEETIELRLDEVAGLNPFKADHLLYIYRGRYQLKNGLTS